jgi:predicted membrane channel-forming protein YqfA (hemolysin III family)
MMTYRTRRRWSLVILLVGLPAYIVVAVTAMNWLDVRFGRQPIWAEVLIYVALGIAFFLPFRQVFRGIGQADPDDTPPR